jgi:putative transcriptional regulator
MALRLKLDKILYDKRLNMNQVSEMTGIRFPTVSDMVKNKAKHWSPENLNKLMVALELNSIDELIEFIPDSEVES